MHLCANLLRFDLVAQATPFALPSNDAPLRFQTADEILAERKQRQGRKAYWPGILREGEVSMLVGRPMAGKSTFACALARSLHLGLPLLGRQCLKARVAYLALERNGIRVVELFSRWRMGDRPMRIDLPAIKGPALARWLEAEIERSKVEILIVDHLQNLARLRDGDKYTEVSNELEPFVQLAKKTGCQLKFLHHQGKAKPEESVIENESDVMGSEAFRACADAMLEATKSGDKYYLRAHVRGIDSSDSLPRMQISIDFANGEATGIDAKQAAKQGAATALRNWLREQDGACTEEEIRDGVQLATKAVHAALQTGIAGVIKTGTGKKGNPFHYLYSSADEQFMAPGRWNGLAEPAQIEEGTL